MAAPPAYDPAELPVGPPPPGVQSNFASPVSRASDIVIAGATCLSLVTLFAALRLYAKLAVMKTRTWDDLTCILGILAGTAFMIIGILSVKSGVYGRHSWDVSLAQLTEDILLLSLLDTVLYPACLWLIKLSVFILYVEVFGILKWLKYCSYGGIVITGIFHATMTIVFGVFCGPRSGHSQASYLAGLASTNCRSREGGVAIAQGIFNVLGDIYLIVLPIPAVWGLQLSLRKKIGVSAMFATGLTALIASILGLFFRCKIASGADTTWQYVPNNVTAFVEMTAGILVSCMPTTTAALKSLRSPISSFISTSRRRLHLSSTDGMGTYQLEGINSNAQLHPAPEVPYAGDPVAHSGPYQGDTLGGRAIAKGGKDSCRWLDESSNDTTIGKHTEIEVLQEV